MLALTGRIFVSKTLSKYIKRMLKTFLRRQLSRSLVCYRDKLITSTVKAVVKLGLDGICKEPCTVNLFVLPWAEQLGH